MHASAHLLFLLSLWYSHQSSVFWGYSKRRDGIHTRQNTTPRPKGRKAARPQGRVIVPICATTTPTALPLLSRFPVQRSARQRCMARRFVHLPRSLLALGGAIQNGLATRAPEATGRGAVSCIALIALTGLGGLGGLSGLGGIAARRRHRRRRHRRILQIANDWLMAPCSDAQKSEEWKEEDFSDFPADRKKGSWLRHGAGRAIDRLEPRKRYHASRRRPRRAYLDHRGTRRGPSPHPASARPSAACRSRPTSHATCE